MPSQTDKNAGVESSPEVVDDGDDGDADFTGIFMMWVNLHKFR